jgi:hypothetical protein
MLQFVGVVYSLSLLQIFKQSLCFEVNKKQKKNILYAWSLVRDWVGACLTAYFIHYELTALFSTSSIFDLSSSANLLQRHIIRLNRITTQ